MQLGLGQHFVPGAGGALMQPKSGEKIIAQVGVLVQAHRRPHPQPHPH